MPTLNKLTENSVKEEIVSPSADYSDVELTEIPVVTPPVFLDDPKYYLWLYDDNRIYATFVAMTEDDVKEAIKNNMVEVTSEIMYSANGTSIYKDGKLQPYVPEIQPTPRKYYIEVDADNYIITTNVAIGEAAIAYADTLGLIEINEEQYTAIGPDSQYIDNKVIKGPPKPQVIPPEAVPAILAAKIANATTQIGILTDKTDPDLVDVVKESDVALLKAWKKFRLALLAMDPANPVWPKEPA